MRHNQNRRSRGRSNNNRKGPNPLTRSYESNGPDVKVRGTAMHVAEKYMTLARDALSSGDNVAAENYLQHAEHYNRIVMAAQAQQQPTQPQFRDGEDEPDDNGGLGRGRDRFGYFNDPEQEEGGENYDAGEDDGGDRGQQRQPQRDYNGQDNRGPDNRGQGGNGGQPRQDRGYNAERARQGYRANENRGDNRNGENRGNDNRGNDNRGENRNGDNRNGDGQARQNGEPRNDRGYNGDRPRGDYREAQGGDRYNGERPRRDFREGRNEGTPEPYTADAGAAQEREFNGGPEAYDQPPMESAPDVEFRAEPDFIPEVAAEEAVRPRRRRAPRTSRAEAGAEGAAGADGETTPDGAAALAAFPE